MKLEEARKYGDACGLETDTEHVNNIILHALNLFVYEEIDKEIDELIVDAKANGVLFAKCGHASFDEGELCYTCKKLAGLNLS